MTKFKNDAAKKVAAAFNSRLAELGMSKYKFLNYHADASTRHTLTRILRGEVSSSICTVAHYADMLGLEIKIVKKNDGKEEN